MDISEEAVTWKKRGDEYILNSNYADAVQCYEYAIHLEPEYSAAWNNLGYCYQKMGRIDDAKKVREKVTELKNKSLIRDVDTQPKQKSFNYLLLIPVAIVIIAIFAILLSGLGSREEEYQQDFQTIITTPPTQFLTPYPTEPPRTPLPAPTSLYLTADDERLMDIITDSTLLYYGQVFIDSLRDEDYIYAMAAAELGNDECIQQMADVGGLRTSPRFTTIKSEYHEYLKDRKQFFYYCDLAARAFYYEEYRTGNLNADEALKYGDFSLDHLEIVNSLISEL